MLNYEKYVKRPLDFVLATLAIICLSPLFLLLVIVIKMKLGSPILFKQCRPGMHEKMFTLYKFRTMTNDCDENGELLPVSERLTPFGRLLRATSLDELPELFNIIKGDMSFIGPRPLLADYLPYYTANERLRHSVRPGLSGLAQVNGRNTAAWQQRFQYDLQYVHHITFLTDVHIFLKTIFIVLKRSDIGEVGVDAPIDFDIARKNEREDRSDDYNTIA